MKILISFLTISVFIFSSCSKKEEYRCESGDPSIVGAICDDGTRSSATGSGACSSHGGVDYWICED